MSEGLVTCALLGTDRRDPPQLEPGPVADVVDDALAETPAVRLLTAVAAATVARRAGVRAGPPLAPLQPPVLDRRPLLAPAAARRWHHLVDHWPVLEDEWLAVATAAGWRPPPDVLVAMLRRARTPERRGAVMTFGAARAEWLVDHVPTLGAPNGRAARRSAGGATRADPAAVPAELREAFELPAEEFAAAVAAGLGDGTYRWAHRAVLVNTVAAMPPGHLRGLIAALSARRPTGAGESGAGSTEDAAQAAPLALWESVIELATVRATMLDELTRSDRMLPDPGATDDDPE